MTEVREQLNDRLTISRITLEMRRAARAFAVVLTGIAVAGAVGFYIVVNISRTALSSTLTLRLAVDDASGAVAQQDQVRFKGIPAGTITGVGVDAGQPVLTIQILRKYGTIYRNARAELRPNTPLMDMYLDIVDRGTPAAGVASANRPLPASQTAVSVNVADVLDTFRASVRTSIATTLDNLGNGLARRGFALRAAFVELVPLLQVAGRISDQLAQRGPLVGQLVHNTAVLTAALGERQRMLRTLLSAGNATVSTLQAGRSSLNATLAELPPTLRAIDSSFAAVRQVLPQVDGALTSLHPIAGQLPGALQSVRLLTRLSTPAVQALQTPVRRLVPFANSLVPLSANLSRAISELLPQVHTVDKVTNDLAECGPNLQGFFQYDLSTWKFSDFRSGTPRGHLVVTGRSSGLAYGPGEAQALSCVGGTPIGGWIPSPANLH
jgi:ABC-type transporter Mla subunit MlaD